MVGKVKVGKSFTGICRYVFREDKNARVLDAVGVRTESAIEISQDFEFQRSWRPGLGNAVMHVALALPVEDAQGRSAEEVSALLLKIGRAYVQEMKLDNTQWALIQHTDKLHPHAHLIVYRVDDNGQTISDKFIGQQSRRVCQGIEQQLGLTVAEQQGRNQAREAGPTHRQATATTAQQKQTADWQRARHEVANVLKDAVLNSGSFEELQTKLKTHSIDLVLSKHEKKTGPVVYGVVFEQEGHRIKGSEVGKAFSAGNLEKGFAQARAAAVMERAEVERIEKQVRAGREQLAALVKEADKAERVGNYGRLAELRYGEIETLTAKNKPLEDKLISFAGGRDRLAAIDAQLVRQAAEEAVKEAERKRLDAEKSRQAAQAQAEQDRIAEKQARERAEIRRQETLLLAYEARRGDEVPLIEVALSHWQKAPDDLRACLIVVDKEAERIAEPFRFGRNWGVPIYTYDTPASRPAGHTAVYVKYRPESAARISELFEQVRTGGGEVYEPKDHQARREQLQAQPQPVARVQQQDRDQNLSKDDELAM